MTGSVVFVSGGGAVTNGVTVPADLREAPPSVKLVWLQLAQADGPLSQDDLVERCQTSKRTVRSALYELELTDHVAHRPDPADARRREYYLAE